MFQQGCPGTVVPSVQRFTLAQLNVVLILRGLFLLDHAQVVSGNLALAVEVPVLVSLKTMTVKHQDRQADIVLIIILVETELMVEISYLSSSKDCPGMKTD